VRFTHDLLTLWYGTADAPAPRDDEVKGRSGVSVVVAVQPPHPCNVVIVLYRVDSGPTATIRAARMRTDYTERVEYHRAIFPDFWAGDEVAYIPTVSCAGRHAPDPETIASLPSTFRLGDRRPSSLCVSNTACSSRSKPDSDRMPFSVDYLATITIPLKEPETIGQTPEGIKVNWYWSPGEGVVAGPKVTGKVRHIGGDWMTIRRDGVGLMDVRATIETNDGALLFVEYPGYYELGEGGYQAFLDGRLPARASTRTTPRFHTAHPSYRWLNRTQCIGIGEVATVPRPVYMYDLYALR
jgi:Protein of unknown function (DUF3237)